jgi:hypothetical protein
MKKKRLTAEQEREIIIAVQGGTMQKELAKKYGVAPSVIHRAIPCKLRPGRGHSNLANSKIKRAIAAYREGKGWTYIYHNIVKSNCWESKLIPEDIQAHIDANGIIARKTRDAHIFVVEKQIEKQVVYLSPVDVAIEKWQKQKGKVKRRIT